MLRLQDWRRIIAATTFSYIAGARMASTHDNAHTDEQRTMIFLYIYRPQRMHAIPHPNAISYENKNRPETQISSRAPSSARLLKTGTCVLLTDRSAGQGRHGARSARAVDEKEGQATISGARRGTIPPRRNVEATEVSVTVGAVWRVLVRGMSKCAPLYAGTHIFAARRVYTDQSSH